MENTVSAQLEQQGRREGDGWTEREAVGNTVASWLARGTLPKSKDSREGLPSTRWTLQKSDNKSAPRVDGFFGCTEQAETKDSSEGGWGGESPCVSICNSDNKINGCRLEGERISEQLRSVALKPSHAFGQMLLSSTGKGPKFLPIPL